MKYNQFQIRAFTFSAREQSFSKAAICMGVTQSSISQHISNLEQAMGVSLFIRRRGGLELTKSGRELYSAASRLVDLEQAVDEAIESFSRLESGTLKIVATAPRPALPLIAAYTKLYPRIVVEFSLASWTNCMSYVREKDVDFAFITEPEVDNTLFTRKLSATRYVAYVNKDHSLANRRDLSLADLVSQTVILPEDGSLTQRVVNQKLNLHGLKLEYLVKAASFPMLKEAVLHNVGIGLFLEDSHFPTHNLKAIPIKELPETFCDFIVVHDDKRRLKIIKSFLELSDDLSFDA